MAKTPHRENDDCHMMEDPLNFEGSGGTLVDFDDGHIPETFSSLQGTAAPSRLVQYPQHMGGGEVHVYDNVLPSKLVEDLYKTTTSAFHKDQQKDSNQVNSCPLPWGSYVTMEEVRNWGKTKQQHETQPTNTTPSKPNVEQYRKHLSIQATWYFLSRVMSSAGTTWNSSIISTGTQQPMFTSFHELQQQHDIHGVAVWCLASVVSAQVQYHLDYAELIRYEHNVIVPPLFAGTIQCASLDSIHGGDFCVQLENGLSHYNHHGYKGNKSGDEYGGWTKPSCNDVYFDKESSSSWVTIPYRYNRMICHSGHLPHLSTPIHELQQGRYRVIVGLNVFCNDIGHVVQRAPEHSNSFRRRIQLHRSLLKKQRGSATSGCVLSPTTIISLDKIRKNKGFTKLLVLAKRERIKEELRRAQRELDQKVDDILVEAGEKGVSLQTIVEECATSNGTWPTRVDVQVHLHHRVKNNTAEKSKARIRCGDNPTTNELDEQGLLSPDAILHIETR